MLISQVIVSVHPRLMSRFCYFLDCASVGNLHQIAQAHDKALMAGNELGIAMHAEEFGFVVASERPSHQEHLGQEDPVPPYPLKGLLASFCKQSNYSLRKQVLAIQPLINQVL